VIITAKRREARARLAAVVREQLARPKIAAPPIAAPTPRILSGVQHVASFGSYEEFVRADRREELIALSEIYALRRVG
jgi:hypothetical protein